MKLLVTASEILDHGDWEEFCVRRGINPYAIREGLMESSEIFELSLEEVSRYGLAWTMCEALGGNNV